MQRRPLLGFAAAAAVLPLPALAQGRYPPGVSDAEIVFGATVPLSGPAASFSASAKVSEACFKVLNGQGGINGRRLKFILADDGYTPTRTVEQTRRLVEEEKVAFLFSSVGTAANLAVRQYLNDGKVPQLFVGSQASTWADDIEKFPYSLGFAPLFPEEGKAVGAFLARTRPRARVGILFQNDDAGKDYARGVKAGLAPDMPSREQAVEFTDTTADSQLISLQAGGADTLVIAAPPRITAQSIRKVFDTGWKPQIAIPMVGTSVANVLTPAGLDKSRGAISACYLRDPGDPSLANDKAVQAFSSFMGTHAPNLPKDWVAAEGYCKAQVLAQLLRQCGDDLSRENIVAQTRRLDIELPLFHAGIRIKTSDRERHPLRAFRIQQFDGTAWKVLEA